MLSDLTVKELRAKAKSKGLKYSGLLKAELVSLLQGKRKNRKSSKGKVAFCFLLYDTIQHLQIWEEFFGQDSSDLHSVYAHVKETNSKTPAWIKKAKVRTVGTNWCGEGLIYAFNQMLKKALKKTDNQFFALVSGSCIPLHQFDKTYRMCTTDPRAKMFYERYDGNVFEDRNDIYNGHQWVVLNRKVAQDYLRLSNRKDKKAQAFIKRFRAIYKENGVLVGRKKAVVAKDTTWLGGCPDEVYPINWLVELYGKTLKKYVKKQMSTYTSWDFEKDPDHPEVFNIKTVKKAKREICARGHIFARKFTEDAADFIAMNCDGKKKPRRVIVRKELVGRLGNQMFQYASALGIAYRKKGTVCIITDEDLIQEDELRNPKDDLINVCKGPFTECGDADYKFKTIPEKAYAKYDVKRFMKDGSIEIETDLDQGFLQSWKYFKPVEKMVREKFRFKAPIARRATAFVKKAKKGGYKVVGIHARRGDHLALGYLKFPRPKYFKNAKKYFKKKYKKVRFVVATNDRKWAQEQFADADTTVITTSKSAAEDLAILGSCDGVIMSLGTFGWWGGWLCGGPVVYYKSEINMKHEVNRGKVNKKDYYPTAWVGLT
jgi:galactoside 2-L-fucosyltransferase 1/2